jgi:hypothetical protein
MTSNPSLLFQTFFLGCTPFPALSFFDSRTEFLYEFRAVQSSHLVSLLGSVAPPKALALASIQINACRSGKNKILNMSSRPLVGKRRDWHKKLFALLKTVKSHKFACDPPHRSARRGRLMVHPKRQRNPCAPPPPPPPPQCCAYRHSMRIFRGV